MAKLKPSPKPRRKQTNRPRRKRVYEAEALALKSLRLIAAPDPKDDLSDAELVALCKDPRQSSELVRHLIDFVKTL